MTAVRGHTSDLSYGKLNSRDLNKLFAVGSGNHRNPLVSRRSREMLPMIGSFNSDYLKFQIKYYDTLDERAPVTTDPATGLSTNGVFETAGKGKCVSGYMANPMGYTPVDNRPLRQSLRVKVEPDGEFLALAEELSALVHSQWYESDVNVTPGSSAGFCGFRHEAQWKIDYATELWQGGRLDLFMRLARTDEVAFANEFETVFAYYAQKRDQIDRLSKKRVSWGVAHALDPYNNPDDWVHADKRVVIDGVSWPEHSATRARLVNAAPWAINSAIAPVSAGAMKHMFHRWPDVWHVNTADHLESLINGHYTWFADASQFDQSHPEEGLDAFHRGVSRHWDENLVFIAEKLLFAPYFARPLAMDGDPVWIGRPFSKEREVIGGNRSGHAWTSIYNKVMMVAAVLHALRQVGYDTSDLDYWLSSRGPVKFINNGDDSVLYAKDKAVLDKVVAALTGKRAVYKLEREEGGVYNGMATTIVDPASLTYKCLQNQFSSVMKVLTNERPIYNPKSIKEMKADLESGRKIFRKYWFLGLADKLNHAHETDVGSIVWGTLVEVWAREMRGYPSIDEILNDARKKVPPIGVHLTQADSEVLEDPRKLHYKYTLDDISAKVAEEVTSKLPSTTFLEKVKALFKGTIVLKGDYIDSSH